MIKIVLPILLSGIIMIAGIFVLIPIDKAATVHTTIQGTQLNNIDSTFQTDMSANATAGCGAAGGDFMVYYTFSNSTLNADVDNDDILQTRLGITNGTASSDTPIHVVSLTLGNQTSASGMISGDSGETINFFGFSNGTSTSISLLEEVGDLALTVVCQSGSAPALSP